MSRLFGIFENKIPGRDLTKEEAEYKGLKGFFTILKNKFWKMVSMNFVYMLFCVPLFILFYLGSQFVLPGGTAPIVDSPVEYPFMASWHGVNVGTSLMLGYSQFWTDLIFRAGLFVFLISIPVLAVGPLQAGFSHNIISFVMGNPVFAMSNMFEKAKANFRQSLVVSIIDLIIVSVIAIDLRIYMITFFSGNGGFLTALAAVIIIVVTVVYLIMHMYIYPLMVTFKMTFRQLFKNSFYFAMTSFVPALGMLLINVLVIYIPFSLFRNPLLHILVSFLILPSMLSLINCYFIYPYVKKYLLEPALNEK